jgi:L-malate glycosyltransferase
MAQMLGEEEKKGIIMLSDAEATQRIPPLVKGLAICSVGELFGGVERHILGLLTGLQSHGIEALLILFNDGELAAQARAQGVEPIILPSRNRSAWGTSKNLADILRQRQIQIVHVHGYKATVICALAHLRYQFATVKTEHGLAEPMRGRPLHALRDKFYHFLDTLATRTTVATVCYVTEELRLHHTRSHAGLRVAVIPNGVAYMDKAQFDRPSELCKEWFNLAIVGRLDTVKGHHVAIEAISSANMPTDVHLQILGVGPTETELRKLANVLGVADRVHFLGFRRNVFEYLAHCDVLLMPSLHEGLPYTLMEAMALNTPVIASSVGGLAEVLQEGNTGLLTTQGDPAPLARAIMELRLDPDYRKRLSENAHRLQRDKYSIDAMSSRYEAIYQQVSSLVTDMHLDSQPRDRAHTE